MHDALALHPWKRGSRNSQNMESHIRFGHLPAPIRSEELKPLRKESVKKSLDHGHPHFSPSPIGTEREKKGEESGLAKD